MKIILTAIIGAMFAIVPIASLGLPGKPVGDVQKWAAHNRALGRLQPGEEGQLTAPVKVPFTDRLVWNVNLGGPRATIDVSEVIAYWHPVTAGGIDFAQRGSTGLRLLKTIYGDALAADYAKARFTGIINGHKRYVGKKFAYEISSDTVHDASASAGTQPKVYQYFVILPK